MRRDIVIAILGLIWLAASIEAKAVRYGSPPEPRQLRAERSVASFLSERGWLQIDRRAVTSDGGYSAMIFERKGCPSLLAVAVLGGEESAQAAVAVLGPRVAYLESGALAADPQFRAFQWHAMTASALSLVGGPADSVPPVLGIWPKPGEDKGSCAHPEPKDWASLSRLP